MNAKTSLIPIFIGIAVLLSTSGCLVSKTQITEVNRPNLNLSKDEAVKIVRNNLCSATVEYLRTGVHVYPNETIKQPGDPKTSNKYCVADADENGVAFSRLFQLDGIYLKQPTFPMTRKPGTVFGYSLSDTNRIVAELSGRAILYGIEPRPQYVSDYWVSGHFLPIDWSGRTNNYVDFNEIVVGKRPYNPVRYSEITKIGIATPHMYRYDCILLYTANGYVGYEYCNEQTKDELIAAYITLCPNAFKDTSGKLPIKLGYRPTVEKL